MPLPTASDVHVNAPLTNMAVSFFQEGASVFDKAFPFVGSSKKTDSYYVWDQADLTRIEADVRGEGAEAKVGGMRLTTASFTCINYALAAAIEDDVVDNADPSVDLEKAKTMYCELNVRMKCEKVWATKNFASGKWGTDLTAGTDFDAWSDAGSTPILDIHERCDVMSKATGFRPNTLVLSAETFTALINHASIIDRIKHTGRDVPSEAILAQLFRVPRVIVGDMMETTSAEEATDTQARILGKHALLCYAAPSPSLVLPSAGYSFVWNKRGAKDGLVAYRMRDERAHSTIIEVARAFDPKVVASSLGVMFLNATA